VEEVDVQNDAVGGQSFDEATLTTVKRTSVSHQRHADDREHRPKRKGKAAFASAASQNPAQCLRPILPNNNNRHHLRLVTE